MAAQSQPSGAREPISRAAPEAATTKALDWLEARERGERLPPHEIEADIWTQQQEQSL